MNVSRIIGIVAFIPTIAIAGGSYEPVKVSSLKQLSPTDYELVVVPNASNRDPYMAGCATFTVRGSFSKSDVSSLSREGHIGAIARLEGARKSGEPINFGWMGPGFQPEPSNRCVVRSRALEYIFENNEAAVLSYYGAT